MLLLKVFLIWKLPKSHKPKNARPLPLSLPHLRHLLELAPQGTNCRAPEVKDPRSRNFRSSEHPPANGRGNPTEFPEARGQQFETPQAWWWFQVCKVWVSFPKKATPVPLPGQCWACDGVVVLPTEPKPGTRGVWGICEYGCVVLLTCACSWEHCSIQNKFKLDSEIKKPSFEFCSPPLPFHLSF